METPGIALLYSVAKTTDTYPLPRIDDTLHALAGSRIFSTLDPKSGYWQVGLDPEDRERTAFIVAVAVHSNARCFMQHVCNVKKTRAKCEKQHQMLYPRRRANCIVNIVVLRKLKTPQ